MDAVELLGTIQQVLQFLLHDAPPNAIMLKQFITTTTLFDYITNQIKSYSIYTMHSTTNRDPPLHQWAITDSKQLPLPQQQRKCTDLCCLILGVIFGLTLFIMALVLMNHNNLYRANYPSDSNGKVCMLDTSNNNVQYPFLYFNSITNPLANRVCVQQCPQQGLPFRCLGNCSINFYQNYPSSNMLGAYCLPSNEVAKQQLLYNAGIHQQFNAIKTIDYVLIGLGIAFGLSIFWMLLTQFLPKIAVWLGIILAMVVLLITAIIFFVASANSLSESKGWAIFLGILCLVILLLFVYYVVFHRQQIELCIQFITIAAECFKENLISILFILLFIALSIGFFVLTVFEYLAFSSFRDPTFSTNDLFYQNSRSWILMWLLAVQTIWGLSFFRDGFNYVISGIAAQWYFTKINTACYPMKRLITKNLGSVASGSLLSGFFYIPSLIISFLCPQANCCCCNLFDLARTDVYSYIYLTGNSFCPSSRQTRYLCQRSKICRQNQTSITIYAFAARILLSFLAVLFVYWISHDNLVDYKVYGILLLLIFFISLYVTCYFVDIHTIMAESLIICFLCEYELDQGWNYKQMSACPEKLYNLINDMEHNTEQSKQYSAY